MSTLKTDKLYSTDRSTGSDENILLNDDGSTNIKGTLTAKGLTYPTADGSAGQFIKTNGSNTLSFAAAGGHVVNHKQYTITEAGPADWVDSISSSSYVDTSVTTTYTLATATNKLLILGSLYFHLEEGTGSPSDFESQANMKWVRDSTDVGSPGFFRLRADSNNKLEFIHFWSFAFIDAPGDTSAHTYKVQAAKTNTDQDHFRFGPENQLSQVIFIEMEAPT